MMNQTLEASKVEGVAPACELLWNYRAGNRMPCGATASYYAHYSNVYNNYVTRPVCLNCAARITVLGCVVWIKEID